jgi:hypothetical protein
VNTITAVSPMQCSTLHRRSQRHVAGKETFNDSLATVRSNENEISDAYRRRALVGGGMV